MIQTAMLVAIFAVQSAAVQAPTGTITGAIRSANGDLVPGMRVMAVVPNSPVPSIPKASISAITETGTDGRYRLTGVPPGAYYIVADRPEDRPSAATYFPGVKKQSAARVMLVTAGRTLADVDFSLAPLPSVSGRLNGLPLSLPPSKFRVVMSYGGFVEETVMAPDGSFEFTNVAPGDYSVFVQPPAFDSKKTFVRVRDNDLRGVEVASPILVSGHVTVEGGTPLPILEETLFGALDTFFVVAVQPEVRLPTPFAERPPWVGVPADGAFQFIVEPGTFIVRMGRLPLGYYVKSITAGGVDLLQEPLVLKNNVVPPELSVTLTTTQPPSAPKEVKVSGRVVVKSGAVLPEWVLLRTESLPRRLTPADPEARFGAAPVRADGSFEFSHVPSGSVSVGVPASSRPKPVRSIVISNTDVYVELTSADIEDQQFHPTTQLLFEDPLTGLPLVGNDPLTLITTLPGYRASPPGCGYRAPVKGVVTGQTPLPAKIELILVDRPACGAKGPSAFDAPIDSTGQFSVPGVPRGIYSLRIASPSLTPLPLPLLNIYLNWGLDGLYVVMVGPDNVEIRLPAIRNVPGRIVVEEGRPAPDQVRVNIQGGSAAAPQPDGRFALTLVEGGQYALFLTGLPQGYEVRSILYAGSDLLREALKLEEGADPAEIVVTLAANGVQ